MNKEQTVGLGLLVAGLGLCAVSGYLTVKAVKEFKKQADEQMAKVDSDMEMIRKSIEQYGL